VVSALALANAAFPRSTQPSIPLG